MKKVAIIQSNYIPWKGYFDIIKRVDEFILYDDMQYTRRDWRNRNKIKTQRGLEWLTIPVETKGNYLQAIKDTVISDDHWNEKHWQSIIHNYSKAKNFGQYRDTFQRLYLDTRERYLSAINYRTKISWSMDYQIVDGKTERLISLCKQAGASDYISGPAAQGYVDEELFKKENIKLTWMDYSGYPEYEQLYPPFEHGVSIIDLIFNVGDDASKYMKNF